MEKIYMENNLDRDNKKKRRKKFAASSVVASLMLVLVAVVGVTVLNFKNSYAINDVYNNLPDKFNTAEVKHEIHSDTKFSVFPYFTEKDIQVFCLEHTIDFKSGVEFNKGDVIKDKGLLYIFANIYPNVKFDDFLNNDLQTWISQVAVWDYLYRKEEATNGKVSETSKNYLSPDEITKIKNARGVFVDDNFMKIYTANKATGGISNNEVSKNDPVLYNRYIKPLVDKALAYNEEVVRTVNIKHSNNITLTDDGKFYKTSPIEVTGNPANDFARYEIKLDSAPEGTIIEDAAGNKLTDLTNFTSASRVIFKVPVDKVTDANKVIKFTVNGRFKIYTGYYYTSPGAQTISSVEVTDTTISNGSEIPLNYTPNVPDTGLNTAQTVYFIGLVILLTGVGIIYANVKPKEN